MSTFRQEFVQCASPAGLHRVAYGEWGDRANPKVLVCVHGLSRVSRDFDFLAAAMQAEYRVVCVDVVGRGKSDWLRDPNHYQIMQYVADMVTVLARLNAQTVHWMGTSMGGLIGMALAAQLGSPIQKLVLNDVGPIIKGDALKRIGEYLGNAPTFANLDEATAYIRAISATFGEHTEAQWRFLTEHVTKPGADGRVMMHYDPKIAVPFRQAPAGDQALWPIFDAIRCPVLVLRGEHSDLLAKETFAEMQARGPKAQGVTIPNVGHAPTLLTEAQIAPIQAFLRSG